MTKDEALRLAVRALERLACLGNGIMRGNSTGNQIAIDALTAIKAALEAKDEPVAWMRDDSVTADTIWGKYGPKKVFDSDMPLYTTPPQRKPLTDEQIMEALGLDGYDSMAIENARAIEAAHGIKGEA